MTRRDWNRRDFLKTAGAATLGALSAGFPRQIFAEDAEKIKPTADTVIVLWMAGGMAHTETFDPKHYVPYSKGMAVNEMLSTFPQINTAVDQIKFSQGLEKIGSVMDRGTNTNGTPATLRPKPSQLRIWALSSRARSGQKIPPCRLSLTSASVLTS